MFCEKCGGKNADEAVFCRKCGFPLTDEEETRIAKPFKAEKDSDEDEKEIFTVRPTLIFVQIGYAAAIVSAFLLVFLLYKIGQVSGTNIPWWLSILAGLSLLLIPAFYHIKSHLLRYTLTDSKIEISRGIISMHTRNVPLRSIQDVSVSSTIFQRMLGFGNLIIENANDTDDKIILKDIRSPKKYADILLKQMRLLDKY